MDIQFIFLVSCLAEKLKKIMKKNVFVVQF